MLRAERAKGRRGVGSARTIAAWIAAHTETRSPRLDQVRHIIAGLDEPLSKDDEILSDITELVTEQRHRMGAVAGQPRTASTRTGE